MRKTFLLALAAAFVFMACHNKSVPTVADRTEHPAPPPPPVAPPIAAADLEAGKAIYTTKCARCHEAKPLDNWTADAWQPILNKMIPKARLDSVQSAQVTAYVKTNARKS